MLLVWCTQQQHQVHNEVLAALITHAFSLHTELISKLQHVMTLALAALRLTVLLLLLTLLSEKSQTHLEGTSAEDSLMKFNFLLQKEMINDEITTVKCAIYSFWMTLSIKEPESNTISEFLRLVLSSHNTERCHNNLLVMYWRVWGEGSHSYVMKKLFMFFAASSLEFKFRNAQKPDHINFGSTTWHCGSHAKIVWWKRFTAWCVKIFWLSLATWN